MVAVLVHVGVLFGDYFDRTGVKAVLDICLMLFHESLSEYMGVVTTSVTDTAIATIFTLLPFLLLLPPLLLPLR